MEIMHRAAPCRNVPVTFTLDRRMNPLHKYESQLDEQEARLRVEGSSIVCDLAEPFRAPLQLLKNGDSVVMYARALEACIKPEAIRPDYIVQKFVRLVNSENGLALNVEEVTWEAMLYYNRGAGGKRE
ncbi:hypothetical protein [Ramlibacter pallidus]|uniref:Uncharacterized protein n=1 Tax=Ramlibacter pallidus TaxID=2780087 RepID=A0ABR9S5D0_9BURK|nr:hypothetical protein [Ramlibacter pallidus]MBE7368686.1 hypothetical protein [Ramlibacter pallidus]